MASVKPTETPTATHGQHPMITLAHDYLLVNRGAERTFAAMAELAPSAPIATLLYDEAVFDSQYGDREIRASFLNSVGPTQKTFKGLLPFMPLAAGRLSVGDCELVLSSSSAFAHGVRTPADAKHVCYCHSPFRYAWHARAAGLQQTPPALRPVMNRVLNRVQRWDRVAAQGRTTYVANSDITRRRMEAFWGRRSVVVYPPVAIERFAPREHDDFVLFVGEIVLHKDVQLAIEAARGAGRRIRIVGTGSDLARLQTLFRDDVGVEFLGRVSDEDLSVLYAEALALVVPNVEEFGIAIVEAQASGRPVVAIDAGGATEIVRPGETGLLVRPGDASAMRTALASPALAEMDPLAAVANASRFSRHRFKREIAELVESASGIRLPLNPANSAPARSGPPRPS